MTTPSAPTLSIPAAASLCASALFGAAALFGATGPARAQNAPAAAPTQLDPVVISAERSRQTTFDAPASISAVRRDTIESAGPQVNISEVLNRVPGITVLNRQNYAQDLQLSIRGFGTRSTFGIRGVRLIVDGIPATMPDGQGQASNIALGSAGRIEVLRGPLAQLYGNAAGGVVQVFTGFDEQPSVSVNQAAGPYGLTRTGVKLSRVGASDAMTLEASHFLTGGYREHSSALRDQFNGKWQHDISADTRISVVANVLDQPTSLDPLGLTRAQWQADPRQAVAIAKTQDARKTVYQQQIGAVLEQKLGERTTATARVYFGNRNLDNALSTPLAAQQAPTSAGGLVSFQRGYWGTGAQVSHAIPFGEGRALRLTGGLEYDRMNEDRQGYINNGGQQGALKRNEQNSVENRDVFAQASFDVTRDWTATAGLRSSQVRFRSKDFFITSANPDDSGGVDYHATNPVLGLSWRALPTLNVYANAGRGFETPTFTELAYRPVGTGLNTDLRAARSRHAELGAKWKIADGHRLDAALFHISTRDELVVDTNDGGRSTFTNAARTKRKGAELSYVGQWTPAWRTMLSLTAMRVRFAEAFTSGSGATAVNVPAGNRLPGMPERSAFAELAWTPANAWGGFNAGLEVVYTGRLYVNDANDDSAPGGTNVNLRAGFTQTIGPWKLMQLLRVDNAGDRRYAGSVIVNEANRRYFEPALPRNWLVSVTASYRWE